MKKEKNIQKIELRYSIVPAVSDYTTVWAKTEYEPFISPDIDKSEFKQFPLVKKIELKTSFTARLISTVTLSPAILVFWLLGGKAD